MDDIHTILFVMRCLAASFAILFSSFVCFLILRHKKLRQSPTNRLVLSLAISDLLTGAVYFPLYVVQVRKVLECFVIIILVSGIFNICALTYDRYLALFKPFRYRFIIPRRWCPLVILCWALPILASFPPLLYIDGPNVVEKHRIYIGCILGFGIILPYFYITITNILVFRQIRSKRKELLALMCVDSTQVRLKRLDRERRVAIIFLITAISLALSWFPVVYMSAAFSILNKPSLVPKVLNSVNNFSILLSSALNPCFYAFLKADIRQVIIRVLQNCKLHEVASNSRASVRSSSKETKSSNASNSLEEKPAPKPLFQSLLPENLPGRLGYSEINHGSVGREDGYS